MCRQGTARDQCGVVWCWIAVVVVLKELSSSAYLPALAAKGFGVELNEGDGDRCWT